MKHLSLILILILVLVTMGYAQLSLPHVFSDHMVLQRNRPVNVWGKATKGENVTVSLNGNTASVVTGKDGKWKVALPEMTAGGPYEMTVSGKTDKIVFRDVLVGDVWICSGQSNMEFKMKDWVMPGTL